MDSAEIRSRFLRYFADRGHQVVPSASLLLDDPTLLFVNAGMVPFKPYFLGEAPAPYPRATSVQKVVRTLDIEEVGKTTRHASFFQMAGNFSFGDYFKEGAIPLAWELLTKSTSDGGYGFDEGRLWVTVYDDDDEAIEIWHRVAGLPYERIQRRGPKDNYWSMGVPGPGGPCSEIYFDRGPEFGREGGPVADEDRYLEVWNLVFMQDELSQVRSKEDFDIKQPLPAKNIDTGMGWRRCCKASTTSTRSTPPRSSSTALPNFRALPMGVMSATTSLCELLPTTHVRAPSSSATGSFPVMRVAVMCCVDSCAVSCA